MASRRRSLKIADMQAVKTRLSVPAELATCHTAEIARYIIEGHVPAQAITRLLAQSRMHSVSRFRACRSARPAWKAAILRFTT